LAPAVVSWSAAGLLRPPCPACPAAPGDGRGGRRRPGAFPLWCPSPGLRRRHTPSWRLAANRFRCRRSTQPERRWPLPAVAAQGCSSKQPPRNVRGFKEMNLCSGAVPLALSLVGGDSDRQAPACSRVTPIGTQHWLSWRRWGGPRPAVGPPAVGIGSRPYCWPIYAHGLHVVQALIAVSWCGTLRPWRPALDQHRGFHGQASEFANSRHILLLSRACSKPLSDRRRPDRPAGGLPVVPDPLVFWCSSSLDLGYIAGSLELSCCFGMCVWRRMVASSGWWLLLLRPLRRPWSWPATLPLLAWAGFRWTGCCYRSSALARWRRCGPCGVGLQGPCSPCSPLSSGPMASRTTNATAWCVFLDPSKESPRRGFTTVPGRSKVRQSARRVLLGTGLMHGPTHQVLQFQSRTAHDSSFSALGEETGYVGPCWWLVGFIALIGVGLACRSRQGRARLESLELVLIRAIERLSSDITGIYRLRYSYRSSSHDSCTWSDGLVRVT